MQRNAMQVEFRLISATANTATIALACWLTADGDVGELTNGNKIIPRGNPLMNWRENCNKTDPARRDSVRRNAAATLY